MKLSRRNFSFGLLGALAAALCPSRGRAVKAQQLAGAPLGEAEPTREPQAFQGHSTWVSLCGRVATQPSHRTFIQGDGSTGHRTYFVVEVSRPGQRARRIPITAWGEEAEKVARLLSKGDKVDLGGYLSYEQASEQGQKFWSVAAHTWAKAS